MFPFFLSVEAVGENVGRGIFSQIWAGFLKCDFFWVGFPLVRMVGSVIRNVRTHTYIRVYTEHHRHHARKEEMSLELFSSLRYLFFPPRIKA